MAATRPSDAPHGPEGAGTGSEAGPEDAKPPQGDTALRERLVRALARTVYRDDDPPPHVLRICEPWADDIAAEVEAWAAEHERKIREQVAAEIRALADQFGSANSLAMGAEAETLRWAADRIARPEGT